MESLFDDEEAERRYQKYKSIDPFLQIEPALLNSAHIEDYVKTTGMICPFYIEKLKSASYEVGLEGTIYFWEGEGDPKIIDLDKDEEFILEENSIAFVSLKTKFRIPDYIALRFNLTITNVHRGILLGTGPLVDPGFEGNLLIPLHNLTTNKYKFTRGEGLIWIEFTKVSNIPDLLQEENTLTGKYRKFRQDKKNRDVKYYFSEAAWGRSIRSSIPDSMQKSRDAAEKAQGQADNAAQSAKKSREEAEKLVKDAEERKKEFEKYTDEIIRKFETEVRKRDLKFTIGGIITGILGLAALIIALYFGHVQISQLVVDTTAYLNEAAKDINNLRNSELKKVERLEIDVQSLKDDIHSLKKDLNKSKTSNK